MSDFLHFTTDGLGKLGFWLLAVGTFFVLLGTVVSYVAQNRSSAEIDAWKARFEGTIGPRQLSAQQERTLAAAGLTGLKVRLTIDAGSETYQFGKQIQAALVKAGVNFTEVTDTAQIMPTPEGVILWLHQTDPGQVALAKALQDTGLSPQLGIIPDTPDKEQTAGLIIGQKQTR